MSDIPPFSSEPITLLRNLLLSHAPLCHARMTEPGYQAKYLRVATPITDAELAAHLAGDVTLACVLQRDSVASIAACDIDSGGEAMVRRVMRAAEMRACHAYGFVLDSDPHSGGHVWIFFEHAHAVEDLQALMRDIVGDAHCPTTEIYPSGADLRLPFGLHRRCNRRGTLLLKSAAASLDLDTDLTGALARFLADVRLTSDVPVRMAQEAQQTRRDAIAHAIAAARPRRCDPDAHWREVIAHFNQSTDLVSLLEGYGARALYHYAGGKTLLHCAAGQDHAHGDKHPSLVVEPGRGHQLGKMICGCYCPTCRLHNQPGQVMDAFEVFCRLEGISKREGVQRIQGGRHAPSVWSQSASAISTPRPLPSHPSLPLRPLQPPPNERVAQQRLVDIYADDRAQPLDRRLLAYVISHGADGQGSSNAALAAALGARPDSVKRAKRRLRELGYIDVAISTDGVSSSTITIVGADAPTSDVSSPPSAEGGVQEAPPFHVSESTCVETTPPRESESGEVDRREAPVEPGVPVQAAFSEPQLRRRRAVLVNMIRAGVSERRRLAFTAELDRIERALDVHFPGAVEQSALVDLETNEDMDTSQQKAASPSCDYVARPDAPHPTLTDAQLTALLCDMLTECVAATQQPLLERVSWHQTCDGVVLVCETHDLAPVTEHLIGVSQRALAGLARTGQGSAVMVRVGKPTPVKKQPMWLDQALWGCVPVWLRPLLIGSVMVDGTLYGATPEHTAGLASHGVMIRWLLDQMPSHTPIGVST